MDKILLQKEEYRNLINEAHHIGYKNGILYVVHKLLNLLDDETISQVSGISIETVQLIRWDYSYQNYKV